MAEKAINSLEEILRRIGTLASSPAGGIEDQYAQVAAPAVAAQLRTMAAPVTQMAKQLAKKVLTKVKLASTTELIREKLRDEGNSQHQPDSKYDQEQLAMGIKVEQEHVENVPVRKEIAKDHLEEDPRYYTHLREMEKKYAADVMPSSSKYHPLKEGLLGVTTPFSWKGSKDTNNTLPLGLLGAILGMQISSRSVKKELGEIFSENAIKREFSSRGSRTLINKLISEGARQTGKERIPAYFSMKELFRPVMDKDWAELQGTVTKQLSSQPALYYKALLPKNVAKKVGLRSREFIFSHGGMPPEVLAHEVAHAYPKGILEKILAHLTQALTIPARGALPGALGLGLYGALTSKEEKESLPWTAKAVPWIGALPLTIVPEELRADLRGLSYLKALGEPTRGAWKTLGPALAHHTVRTLPLAIGSLGAYLALKRYHDRKHQEYLGSSGETSKSAAKIASDLLDTVKVRHIDGNEARKKNIEFALGGNHYRYNFIPKNEVWLENPTKNKNDQIANVTHEIVERMLCKEKGMPYESAHEVASKVERKLRSTLEKKSSDDITFPEFDRHKYLKLCAMLLPLTASIQGLGATVRSAAQAKAKTFPWREVPGNILKWAPDTILSALLGGAGTDYLVNKEILGQREGAVVKRADEQEP